MPRRKRPFWANWTDDQLLELRICDLDLDFESSWLAERRDALYTDLERRGFKFRPHMWLSNEWFTPDGVPGFAIPFYLAHPRLIQLERSRMLEVEGGTREDCLKIMRHETGHALMNAYRIHWRRNWQRRFGKASQKYPKYYRPNPASRHYVQHLRLYYAQSHPTEDFAETFAVWLQSPKSVWMKRYEGWPALRKLEMVDELMNELMSRTPPVRSKRRIDTLLRARTTLREFYDERREAEVRTFPSIYDRDLRKLFSDDPAHNHRKLASTFLRENRAEIRRLVARWTGEYEYTLEQVLQDMIGRTRELRLRAVGSAARLKIEFAIVLTANTLHFHYSRRNWFAL
jgi:hypothetical protein